MILSQLTHLTAKLRQASTRNYGEGIRVRASTGLITDRTVVTLDFPAYPDTGGSFSCQMSGQEAQELVDALQYVLASAKNTPDRYATHRASVGI